MKLVIAMFYAKLIKKYTINAHNIIFMTVSFNLCGLNAEILNELESIVY